MEANIFKAATIFSNRGGKEVIPCLVLILSGGSILVDILQTEAKAPCLCRVQVLKKMETLVY